MRSYVVATPDEELAEQVALMLRQEGGRVSLACDGDEALYLVERDGPQVVILDLDLPVLSGLAVLELLRADPATKRLPVIALSHRSYDEAADALQLGLAAFMSKPTDPEQLAAFATRVAGRMEPAEAEAMTAPPAPAERVAA